jgi:hypothetical protein
MPLATLLLCSPWPSGPPQCAVVGRMLLVYRFTKTYTDYPVVRASNFFHR